MNSFNQYLINKIDVMEGIDFKSNKKRQLMKDKIKEQNKKNDRIHNIMMTSVITILVITGIMLLNEVSKETKKAYNNCLEIHSQAYCDKNA